jgi:hypothetical protein
MQRKIGPDPASINAAKIGGIVANNSSGMCCGTAQNSYNTLAGLRLVLADGSVVDSEDAGQRRKFFRQTHGNMLDQLARARPHHARQHRPGGKDSPQVPTEEHHRLVAQCVGRLSTSRSTSSTT